VVSTGVLIAEPYIGTKLGEFGAEVIHVERPGGDTFRYTAPLLTRGPHMHGCDEAEVAKNKLSMGLDLKNAARNRAPDGALENLRCMDGIVGAWHS
jgi:crotonobetainyl-CoA:carnitine CoA-transferase CaiB-like acyl-CoA transferase